MKSALIAVVIAVLWFGAGFAVGWKWRDDRAKTVAATTASVQQEQRADHAEQARATDASNSQAGAQAQQQRAENKARTESTFQHIEHKASEYAKATSLPDTCGLDGDGLRAWREANAGTYGQQAEPVHIGGPADGQDQRPAAASERSVGGPADESHRSGEAIRPVAR